MRFACLALPLVLGVACAEGGGGRRVDAPTADAGPTDGSPGLPDLQPGVDTGPGTPDLGMDQGPPRSCSSPAECDDGNACNGTETCSAGVCQAGTPVTCDDGVACTRDTCTDPGGSCLFMPDDSLCTGGETCTATGCSTGSSCSETPCKLTNPQCGCGAGQACYMNPDGVRGCATAGSGAVATACEAIADCTGGSTCVGLNDSVAACHQLCTTDADCGGRAGALCILGLADTAGDPITDVETCSLGCEPATNTGCPAGSWCFLGQESEGAMRPISHCSGDPVGVGTQGSICTSQDDCAPGLLCLDPGSGISECLQLCRNPSTTSATSSPDCPSSFYSCYPLTPTVSLGATTYGVCDL